MLIAFAVAFFLAKGTRPVERVIQTALVNYGSSIFDVEVQVGTVNIDFDKGVAKVERLRVANPVGFKTEYAINANELTLKLDFESLNKDTIIFEDITIVEADIIYEYRSSGTNLDKLAENAVEYANKELGLLEAQAASRLLVDKVNIINPHLQISHRILKGKTLKLNLPDIRLQNPGNKIHSSSPAEIAQDILSAIKSGTGMAAASLSMGKDFQNDENRQTLVVEELESMEDDANWIFQ